MRFSSFAILATLAAAPSAFASVGVHCGTTEDATLSDCQKLLTPDTWNGAWAGSNSVCHFGLGNVAHNVGCLGGGNCCVYVAGVDPNTLGKEQARTEAQGLLGCADTGKNLVNALQTFSDGHGVCISNGHGCGDCFDDSDFST
ncbi:hypothetical protein BDZ94DRAFT_1315615 [Collybia nuda]|uniref:Uncharacterized protein n=1 Tax=Collybia nuda TaxID=64659 RepID=A0A9P6C8H7_9AGAR|nr:hypothetical protein BDZ94DRAFT_1315615 [Collybia nuda]